MLEWSQISLQRLRSRETTLLSSTHDALEMLALPILQKAIWPYLAKIIKARESRRNLIDLNFYILPKILLLIFFYKQS